MTMKRSQVIKVIAAVIILVVIVMNIISCAGRFREPVVLMNGGELIIQSPYGVTVPKNEINSVRLIDDLPTLIRGAGFGVGNTQKGKVSVSNLGGGFAYVKVNSPPYIYLELISDDNYMFLNLHDANETRRLYESIRAWLRT